MVLRCIVWGNKMTELEKLSKEEILAKFEYSGLEDTLVESKSKKILLVTLASGVESEELYQSLTGICEKEGIEVETVTSSAFLEYSEIMDDRPEYLQHLQSFLKYGLIKIGEGRKGLLEGKLEEVCSLMIESMEEKIEGSELVVLYSGCPCCGGIDQAKAYAKLLETFGEEMVYLLPSPTVSQLEDYVDSLSEIYDPEERFPFSMARVPEEVSEESKEQYKECFKDDFLEAVPEKVRILLGEKQKL